MWLWILWSIAAIVYLAIGLLIFNWWATERDKKNWGARIFVMLVWPILLCIYAWVNRHE